MAKVALYVRVSTQMQQSGLEAQQRALESYCQHNGITEYLIFSDEGISGAKSSRPGLDALMTAVEARNVSSIVVYSFSRFARSVKQLLEALELFDSKGISFVSISEQLNTTTSTGRFVFTILAALAQMERAMIVERVKNGLVNARAKGKRLGRPTSVNKDIVKAFVQQGLSYREIAKLTGASHWTIREAVKQVRCSEDTGSEQTALVG